MEESTDREEEEEEFTVYLVALAYPGSCSELRKFPSNDIDYLRKCLVNHCGIKEENIKVLQDVFVKGSKQQFDSIIMDQLFHMTMNAKEGEKLIFYMSGHGYYDTERDGISIFAGFEVDGAPCFILDSDLKHFLEGEGVHINLFFDICHSGQIVADAIQQYPKTDDRSKSNCDSHKSHPLGTVFTACHSRKGLAYAIFMQELGLKLSVFTWALVQVFTEFGTNIKPLKLVEQIYFHAKTKQNQIATQMKVGMEQVDLQPGLFCCDCQLEFNILSTLSPMDTLQPQMERKLLHEKKRKEQEIESTKEDLLHGKKPKEQKVESTEGDLLYDGEKPKEFECPVYAETLKVYNKLEDIDTIDLKWCPIIPDKHAYLKHEKKFAELFKKHEEKKKRWMLIEEEKERLEKGKRGAVTDKLKPCYAMLLA